MTIGSARQRRMLRLESLASASFTLDVRLAQDREQPVTIGKVGSHGFDPARVDAFYIDGLPAYLERDHPWRLTAVDCPKAACLQSTNLGHLATMAIAVVEECTI